MSANISQDVTPNPVLMQAATKECLKTKIHQESLGLGFHGRLAHLRCQEELCESAGLETSESFD